MITPFDYKYQNPTCFSCVMLIGAIAICNKRLRNSRCLNLSVLKMKEKLFVKETWGTKGKILISRSKDLWRQDDPGDEYLGTLSLETR